MSSGSRTFLIVFGLAVLLLSVAVAAVAVSVHRCGMLSVDICDYSEGGQRIAFKLPGAIVPIAVQFVPDHALGNLPCEVREHVPLLREACNQLARQPDFVMVEVHDGDEHVIVAKRGRNLVVEVESHDEEVHVTVPLSMMKSLVQRIERFEKCDVACKAICRTAVKRIDCSKPKRIVVES